MVLLIAEMIAMRYYRALREGTEEGSVPCAVFARICRDEDGHVAFHVDFLHAFFARRRSPLLRVLAPAVWRLLYRLACLLVLWDHRGVFRAVGVSPAEFWCDANAIFDTVSGAIFDTAAIPAAAAAVTTGRP